MRKPARRQHFVARFYLRNFAEPMFSDNLLVYTRQARCWEKRTPNGIGWFPHLSTIMESAGKRTDDFDLFLKQNVEDPGAPALKNVAESHRVDECYRSPIALFLALTAARSPKLLRAVRTEYLQGLPANAREETENLLNIWRELTGNTHISLEDFLKAGECGAIWICARSLQERLLKWNWYIVLTTQDKPFVTSDWPVYAEWDNNQDVRLVSFPVSSEVALLVISTGQLRGGRTHEEDVCALNRQTMQRATDFIVSCRTAFPGDDLLGKWQARGDQ